MREFIELYDRVFINIDTNEAKAIEKFDKVMPIIWLGDKKYIDFIEYINTRCKGHIEVVRSMITCDNTICCKVKGSITANTIVLLNCINLNDFMIYVDNDNLFIDFGHNLSVEQDNK